MEYPTLKEEQKLWQKGYRFVACIDEVGRGPLAGPVVAVAVVLTKLSLVRLKLSLGRIRDSKKLSPKRREQLYRVLKNNPALQWATGKVPSRVIDRINIFKATKLAMQRAVRNLEKKLAPRRIQFVLMDGNMELGIGIPEQSIVKGDEKVFSCALASIIAKVRRDRLMRRYHKKYPRYGFDRHKGYGTLLHLARLKKYGPCKIHRKSFGPCLAGPRTRQADRQACKP